MTEVLRRFQRQRAAADVPLVFYSGHGIEMRVPNPWRPLQPWGDLC
ncbi:MAG: caspase family protein [Acidobacteria bacterium]|nr:caspase family protein [Acidobacteriota bacterium]